MTATAFLAAWFVHLLAAASPGPAILMAARTGVTEGMRTGAFLAIGLGAGALVWAVAALFGLSLVFQAAPAVLWAFKIAGGLFLLWIALNMWRHAHDPLVMSGDTGSPPRSARSALWLGLATQLANPKPAVFFGAVFVGTIPPGTPILPILALLAAVFANEVVCNIAVARMFSFPRPRAAYARLKTVIDRGFGGVLGLLGIKIAVT
jgi:threonine/homoserine/homoserine lactone efflux protein